MATESKELLVLSAELNPLVVFGRGGVDDILHKITEEVRTQETDISTPAGRMAVASLAYKIARSKTALDDMGKALVAGWKERAAAVDTERRRIREALDALKEEVRKPLTDWEQTDARRIALHEEALASIVNTTNFEEDVPSLKAIRDALDLLAWLAVSGRDWQEFTKRAGEALAMAKLSLVIRLARTEKCEAEAAELKRLREDEEARQLQEREERIRTEAAEKAAEEARQEGARKADVERQRVEKEKREAAEKADAERDEARVREQRLNREKQEAEQRAAKAEREARLAKDKAKADTAAAVERERKRAKELVERTIAAAEKREQNTRRRAKVHAEIKVALLRAALTLDANLADHIIEAIAAGNVPHVSIEY